MLASEEGSDVNRWAGMDESKWQQLIGCRFEHRSLGSLQLEGKGVLPVTLPNAFAFDLWGIDRHAQKRALSVLEGAGLIFCKITLLDPRP